MTQRETWSPKRLVSRMGFMGAGAVVVGGAGFTGGQIAKQMADPVPVVSYANSPGEAVLATLAQNPDSLSWTEEQARAHFNEMLTQEVEKRKIAKDTPFATAEAVRKANEHREVVGAEIGLFTTAPAYVFGGSIVAAIRRRREDAAKKTQIG